MRLSKHGRYEDMAKSPYNFEAYDSELELRVMMRLEADTDVDRWTKRHGITIPWVDNQKRMRRYFPDFLVQYQDGTKKLIEAKDKSRMDSDDVQRKRKAAELWCKRRGMEYFVMTL